MSHIRTLPSHSYNSVYQGNHCSALLIGCEDFCLCVYLLIKQLFSLFPLSNDQQSQSFEKKSKPEEFDPYSRSWHGSQYGSR